MPRTCRDLYCTKHLQGPLDVWYDCEVCCQGTKEEALKHVRLMTHRTFQNLSKRCLSCLGPENERSLQRDDAS